MTYLQLASLGLLFLAVFAIALFGLRSFATAPLQGRL
jgi:hypothetical protein